MKTLLNVILWVWQLPQNFVGIVFRLIYGQPNARFRGVPIVVSDRFPGGISLGRTIIVKYLYCENNNMWNHEYGHTRQSLYLGPLYLLVIGLPSLIHAALYRPEKGNYYDFYTEKWADRLGGVNRNI